MQAWRKCPAIWLAAVLLAGAVNAVLAQSDAELNALLKQSQQLQREGKYTEALDVQRSIVAHVESNETASNTQNSADAMRPTNSRVRASSRLRTSASIGTNAC